MRTCCILAAVTLFPSLVNGFACKANCLVLTTRARFQTTIPCRFAESRFQRIVRHISVISNHKPESLPIRRFVRGQVNCLPANHRNFIQDNRSETKVVLSMATGEWIPLGVPPLELRCDATLVCGQSFRWRKTADDEWSGVISGRLV
jgi:hypothetical protein